MRVFLFYMKIFSLSIWLPLVLVTALELSSHSALAYLLHDMWELSSLIPGGLNQRILHCRVDS